MKKTTFRLFASTATISAAIAAACATTQPDDTDDNIGPVGDTGGSGADNGAGSGGQDTSAGGGGAGSAALPQQTWKVLDHQYQAQETGYWCGPAASRIALSTRMNPPTQGTLAGQLGTTTNGTDWIGQVTKVLNDHLGARYATVEMPTDPPSQQQRDRLWDDIVLSIDAGHGIVANIVAPASNHPPGYPNYTIYHYVAIIGYNPATRQVYVADSANFGGNNHYWLSFDQMATLIPPKGYSTYRCGVGRTGGKIDERYATLGGCNGFLGPALTNEMTTPDGAGRYNVFQHGSIYWSPSTGAFEVHGAIRDRWAELGWEAGALGYPLSNETKTPDNVGRFSVFQGGSIYWSPSTGAWPVRGAIRDAWATEGWETGSLGYPISDEYAVSGGRRSDFQHGSITWTAATNSTTVTHNP
jgi:hypothetical protein